MHRMGNHNSTGPWRATRRRCSLPTLVGMVGLVLVTTVGVASAQIVHQEAETGTATASPTSVATSANLTSVADHLYLAAVSLRHTGGSGDTVTSVTGLGLTWTLVNAQCAGRDTTRIEIWKAQGSPTGDGTVTANLSGSLSAVIAVSRYSGVDTTTPTGNTDSANSNGVGGACTGGTDSASWSFTTLDTLANSVVFAAVAHRNRTNTPGTGYTERAELRTGTDGNAAGAATADQLFAASTTDLTVDGTLSSSQDWGAAAVEILDSPTSSAATYDFATCMPGTDCFAYGTFSDFPANILADRFGTTDCATVVSAGAYTALSASDATGGDTDPNRYTAPDEGSQDESCTVFEFELQQPEASITQIAISWEGYGDQTDVVHLYVWDYSLGCYSDGQGTCMTAAAYDNPAATGSGDADFSLTETITSNITNFVDETAGNELTYLVINSEPSQDVFHDYTKAVVTYSVLADLTGTLSDGAVDDLIVAGGETLIITLTNDTWEATIGGDNAKTTALIDGIDSAQSEDTGWNAEVQANLDFNDVTRTSDTVVTITLGAEANYAITANETVTVTVPATAVAGTSALVATPTFVIVTPKKFGYRKSITIDHTKVGASGTAATTLSNFPVVYSVTDVNLKTRANDPVNGRVEDATGRDILFRALDDATCGGTAPMHTRP